jgi:CPA1 family monovalent cation:H+ antiporter
MNHHSGLSLFDAAAVLMVMVATLAYLNHRYLKMPQSVAMTGMGALASLLVIAIDKVLPDSRLSSYITMLVARVDFQTALLDGMLSFLLFAGALHVDWPEIRRGRWLILVLSTIGVLLSTALVGGAFYAASLLLDLSIPLVWCFVFGALISPTDPVAVMGVMKRTDCPASLQATVAGESLFNDGVGVVIFTILLGAALGSGSLPVMGAAQAFFVQALGGVAVGLAAGWLGYAAMKSIEEYHVELMITLAIVMGGYAFSSWLGVSGPVAMAVAGLLIGNQGVALAMEEQTRDHVLKFWALIDEMLNAVLFLLIGLEITAVSPHPAAIALGMIAIPIVLIARTASVVPPLAVMSRIFPMTGPALPTLLWGGLRGGISIAMALSLPESPQHDLILTATYLVVLFSVIVQGGTISRIVERAQERHPCSPAP